MNEIENAIEQLKIDKELAKRDYISPTNHEEFDLAILALEKQVKLKEKLKEYEDGHINAYELLNELKTLADWSVKQRKQQQN